jgi:hypothetical protein
MAVFWHVVWDVTSQKTVIFMHVSMRTRNSTDEGWEGCKRPYNMVTSYLYLCSYRQCCSCNQLHWAVFLEKPIIAQLVKKFPATYETKMFITMSITRHWTPFWVRGLQSTPTHFYHHHHLKACPLYSGFPSPKTKFRHLSLSLVSSSVSPWFVMLRPTPSTHLSLGLPLLRVPSGSHSKIFYGSLFPGIPFTNPNRHNHFSSITSKMFFPISMITIMVPFWTFSFPDFLADPFFKIHCNIIWHSSCIWIHFPTNLNSLTDYDELGYFNLYYLMLCPCFS